VRAGVQIQVRDGGDTGRQHRLRSEIWLPRFAQALRAGMTTNQAVTFTDTADICDTSENNNSTRGQYEALNQIVAAWVVKSCSTACPVQDPACSAVKRCDRTNPKLHSFKTKH